MSQGRRARWDILWKEKPFLEALLIEQPPLQNFSVNREQIPLAIF
jgi:hypothetical protein